jgi:LPS sulfotransferase NodH
MSELPTPDLPADFHSVLKPTIIIAMTARTGSTQLCSILGQLGEFGLPSEFLNPRGPMARFVKAHGIEDMRTYLETLASDAPIFCLKVTAIDWTPIAARARIIFPQARFVYLDRRDIDSQARSMARALHTGLWHVRRDSGAPSPPVIAGDVPEDLVQRCRWQLLEEKSAWRRYFTEHCIAPLTVLFEDLVTEPEVCVRRICSFAGVDLGNRPIPPGHYRRIAPMNVVSEDGHADPGMCSGCPA